MEDTIAVWLIFGFMPALAAVFGYLRWRRHDDLKRMIRGGGAYHAAGPVPDGKTMIELEKLRLADRDKARQLFERLSLEKLDVLKTSIQSGYKEEELARLDDRLERIIGSERLQRLLDEGTQTAPSAAPAPLLPSAELQPGPAAQAKAGQAERA